MDLEISSYIFNFFINKLKIIFNFYSSFNTNKSFNKEFEKDNINNVELWLSDLYK